MLCTCLAFYVFLCVCVHMCMRVLRYKLNTVSLHAKEL